MFDWPPQWLILFFFFCDSIQNLPHTETCTTQRPTPGYCHVSVALLFNLKIQGLTQCVTVCHSVPQCATVCHPPTIKLRIKRTEQHFTQFNPAGQLLHCSAVFRAICSDPSHTHQCSSVLQCNVALLFQYVHALWDFVTHSPARCVEHYRLF